MGKTSAKPKKAMLTLAALRAAIKECAFKPNEQPMKTFIEISTDKTYIVNRAKEELEMYLKTGEKKSLIFAIRFLLISLAS